MSRPQIKQKIRTFHKLVPLIIITSTFILLSRCESSDRFFRPNLPEKLSCVGIIDADDTSRFISFEKSYQEEYFEELNDSLREFSFSIKSSDKSIFSFSASSTVKSLMDMKIPDTIIFYTNEKYYLEAKEKSFQKILSEITVPDAPNKLTLLSINIEKTKLTIPEVCGSNSYKDVGSAVIDLSFETEKNKESYYLLYIGGVGIKGFSSSGPYFSLMEFSVRECNTPGFYSTFYGPKRYYWMCSENNKFIRKTASVNAYIFDGRNIPDNKCVIKISTQLQGLSPFDFISKFHIKLLSIPKDLYLFEKSVNSYNKAKDDPFSEPVNLEGNIRGGYGVFAICRSTFLNIESTEGWW